ncbi:serine/threonine protein kinase [Calothrix sp. FACHB-1219]|uniref:serine/threonine protein kinase n=1 Tax=unclassified Calothrix TaxID=2619626 RepID=UPI001684086C|nr:MULTISPECIES: serine/threonine-protein kinase [unclassified Calothrix]MBD2204571.1 serine/threonine protein kinase [Calothrix sp. FACHB-168]MBD2219369.1 serine/threonine protein kinase [Calothrix sp. FACHB-1219]
MISYPDFRENGYQVIRELGRNREGGRITWLALKIDSQEQVVVKQFCFAQFGSSWSGFEAHQREIEVLEKLAHPGIPKYIDSFSISDGFCLIQEYINAENLAELIGHFELEEIKQIAIQVLEILVYLQNLKPGVIHRDIKPENILVDEECNVYLIDFGFARIGSQEVAGSSVFKGTPGFIPPEQMFEPTKATDLYALGATLICLLTEIRSTEIRELCDRNNPYQIQFQNRLPRLSLSFIGWLEKMVQPLQKDRFSTAKEALAALKPIDVIRVAGVDFSETVLEFKANRLGEKLTQSITVENPIADTLLQGRWEVAPHPHDPPHTPDDHAWIAVTPAQFVGNHTQCQVLVDTSKLMADKQYKRQLILHSNAYPATHTLTVKVQTAALPIEKRKIPFGSLIGLFLVSVVVGGATTWFITNAATAVGSLLLKTFGYGLILFIGISSLMLGFCLGYCLLKRGNSVSQAVSVAVGAAVSFAVSFAVSGAVSGAVAKAVGMAVGMAVAWAVVKAVAKAVDWVIGFAEDSFTNVLILLILGFGSAVGTGIIAGFLNPFILLALTGTSLPTLSMLLYSPLKTRKLITKYRDSEEYLIKP